MFNRSPGGDVLFPIYDKWPASVELALIVLKQKNGSCTLKKKTIFCFNIEQLDLDTMELK